MRFSTVILAAVLLLMTGPSAVAQVIRGEIVERETLKPIEGAFISLRRTDEQEQRGVLSDSAGHFILRAPSPGEFVLKAERIGFRTVYSDPLQLAANETFEYRFAVPVEPISLEGIEVSGTGRCNTPREEGALTSTLWEEARKALSLVTWVRRDHRLPYQIQSFERTRSLVTLGIEESRIETRSGFSLQPFRSSSAEELSSKGYVRASGSGTYEYFGLDAETLLSDAFLATHCFRVRRPPPGSSGLIGLAFEPIPGHSPPDIDGVLWLNRRTSELQYLEFNFTRHFYPFPVPQEPFGGLVSFRRLENGAWMVEKWRLRMPQSVIGVRPNLARAPWVAGSRRDELLAAQKNGLRIREEGGALRFIVQPVTETHQGTSRLEGTVFDSVRGRPLAGAMVFAASGQQVTTSLRDGRYYLNGLPAGNIEIGFLHPFADSIGLPVDPVRVTVQSGEISKVDLAIPAESSCTPETFNSSNGVLVGFVYAHEGGPPMAGVGVRVSVSRGTGSRRTRTDEYGRFLFCELPTSVDLRVIAEGIADSEWRITEPRILQIELFGSGRP